LVIGLQYTKTAEIISVFFFIVAMHTRIVKVSLIWRSWALYECSETLRCTKYHDIFTVL